eukprot:1138199-Pelagomonas_calceolata.AAC.8
MAHRRTLRHGCRSCTAMSSPLDANVASCKVMCMYTHPAMMPTLLPEVGSSALWPLHLKPHAAHCSTCV